MPIDSNSIFAAQTNISDQVPSHIAVIGNALPRRCGLATFTSDTVDALRARFPHMAVAHFAMDDDSGVAYAADIRLITAADLPAYREAAGIRRSGCSMSSASSVVKPARTSWRLSNARRCP